MECKFWVWNWSPWVWPSVSAVPTFTILLEPSNVNVFPPTVRIPVTAASPSTTKAVVPPPIVTPPIVPIPLVVKLSWVPIPDAVVPFHFLVASSYCNTWPLISAVLLSTSSKNSSRVSPPPPIVDSCCWIRFKNNL